MRIDARTGQVSAGGAGGRGRQMEQGHRPLWTVKTDKLQARRPRLDDAQTHTWLYLHHCTSPTSGRPKWEQRGRWMQQNGLPMELYEKPKARGCVGKPLLTLQLGPLTSSNYNHLFPIVTSAFQR